MRTSLGYYQNLSGMPAYKSMSVVKLCSAKVICQKLGHNAIA